MSLFLNSTSFTSETVMASIQLISNSALEIHQLLVLKSHRLRELHMPLTAL